jgi:hypothetical protein
MFDSITDLAGKLAETGYFIDPVIRREPGLVSISVENAVYCENCETVSTSSGRRCGLCGSEDIARLVPPIPEPWDPGPAPAAVLAA